VTLLRLHDVVHAPGRRRPGEQLLKSGPHLLAHRTLEPSVVRGRAIPRRGDEQLVGAVGRNVELGPDETGDSARLAQNTQAGEQRHDLVAAAGLRPQHKHASDHGGGL
jgi:hypothetical protein